MYYLPMARVKFTRHLVRFFPDLADQSSIELDGGSVHEILKNLDKQYSGLSDYIVDEHGRLRKHVNIFINKSMINDREQLSDQVSPADEIYIFQALSGG